MAIDRFEYVRPGGSRKIHPVKPARVSDLGERVAIGRRRPQNASNQQTAAVRDGVGKVWVDAVEYAPLELCDGLSAKRKRPDDHEVEQNAERPDVDVWTVVAVVTEELGRSVGRRTAERRQRLVGSAVCTEAEVADLDEVLRCEENVLGLEVPVNDVLTVLSDVQTPQNHAAAFLYNRCSA